MRKGLGLLLSGAVFLAGCSGTPKIVRDFGAIYDGRRDDAFQKRIYDGETSSDLIKKIREFYGCSIEEAEALATAQRGVY